MSRKLFFNLAGVLILAISVFSYHSFNSRNSPKTSPASVGNGLGIANNQNSQDIGLNNEAIKMGICISTCPSNVSSQSISPSRSAGGTSFVSNPYSAQRSANNPSLMQYLPPSYSSSPMPDFDFGRPSPSLNVPPQPNCGANADSSYYANCMDSYCGSYPLTSICLNR